jgi:outer membrane lipoprotein
MRILASILLTVFLLSGCATTPKFDKTGISHKLTPTQASDTTSNSIGQRVIWGGMILSAVNLADATQLEVLAYPLNNSHRPDPDAKPLGRFLLRRAGYLETKEYAEGRHVSVQGRIVKIQQGQIGEKQYLYPVVESEQVFLWPKDFEDSEPQFQFGFGVILGG